MELSIVTTMYYSAQHLKEFYSRCCAQAEKIAQEYEIIFVNDGSPDDSSKIAISLYEEDPRVRVIELSRNFGHHKAIMTGLSHARGQLVFLLDCDLEESPELLATFHEKIIEEDVDVVYGVQTRRRGRLFEQLSGAIFYKFFNLLSTDPIPTNLVTARLMRRSYVNALIEHREREVCLAGLWATTGFKQHALTIHKRHTGKTTYSLAKKIANFTSAVTSFSNKPLAYIFYLGCFIVTISSISALYLIIRRLFFGVLLPGWPSLMVSIWLLGGLTIFSVGVIGIYLSKVFSEVKQRPYTIIKKIYEKL